MLVDVQYATPFTCPECKEHTFETDETLETAMDLAEAHCTHCGHELTETEIVAQGKAIPEPAIEQMLENAAEMNRPR